MQPLKAIETRYKGYRFRSRTEARWAVAFDAMEIEWEYEKEGYELPSGWYLPDFWLPGYQVFLEVKGATPSVAETHKLMDLSLATDEYVGFLIGQVSARPIPYAKRLSDSDLWQCGYGTLGEPSWADWYYWIGTECRVSGVTDVSSAIGQIQAEYFLQRKFEYCRDGNCDFCESSMMVGYWDVGEPAARSARFEHGERGW